MRLIAASIVIILMITLISFATIRSSATYPTSFGNPYPHALNDERCSLCVMVVQSINASVGVPDCYVAIVNAFNRSQEYANGTTDSYGRFQFFGINATYSSMNLAGNPAVDDGSYSAGRNAYVLYAYKSPYGQGYSDTFGMDSDPTCARTAEVLLPHPCKVTLSADQMLESVNGTDVVKIYAYVVDDANVPVNGTVVDFSVGASNWTYPNGSLNANSSQYASARTVNGTAIVNYGWFPGNKQPNQTVKIIATARLDKDINDVLNITFQGSTVKTSSNASPSTMPSVALAANVTKPLIITITSAGAPAATQGPKATPFFSEIAAMSIIMGMAIATYSAGKKK